MNIKLSTSLLTPETSAVLLLDYQAHVMEGYARQTTNSSNSTRALARATKVFNVPVILSTIGVRLRGDHPTIPSLRADLADEPSTTATR